MLRYLLPASIMLWIFPVISRAKEPPRGNDAGLYFIQNFDPKEYGAHSQNWAVAQDNRGIIYIGNGNGVLEYDGSTWRVIQMPNKSVVRSLAMDKDGKIYVGAHAEMGYLAPDSSGLMRYHSLLDQIDTRYRDFNNVWKVHMTPRGIYFRTNSYLFLWADNRMKVWKPADSFHKSFYIDGAFFIRDWGAGLLKMERDSLVLAPEGEKFIDIRIDVMLPSGDGRILIGSRTTGLYLYDGFSVSEFRTQADPYLKENQIYDGVSLPDGKFALATLRGGVAVIDRRGHFLRAINTESGLRDNTVWSLALDREGALWLALNDGLSRIELQSPLSFFSKESGLQSSIESLIRYNGKLYAATGLGLFYLDTSRDHGESSTFRPVPGIEGQAWSLITADDVLLAGTSQGTYQVADEAQQKLNDKVTFFLHRSVRDPELAFLGMGDGLGILEQVKGEWIYRGQIPDITEEIRTIAEDSSGDLWLGTAFHGVLRVHADHVTGGVPGDFRVERFGSPNRLPPGEVVVSSIGGKILFGTEKGLREFNLSSNSFNPVTSPGTGLEDTTVTIHRIAGDGNRGFWISGMRDHIEIRLYEATGDGQFKYRGTPLNRISSLGPVWSIYPDGSDGHLVWFGTNSGVVRYDRSIPYRTGNVTTLIRRVMVNGDSLIFGGSSAYASPGNTVPVHPEFLHGENNIRFEYACPSFDDPASNSFQYRLEGFDRTWSDWTGETVKEYTNLPHGAYYFRIRSRNIYQHTGEEAVFPFSILRPWYRTWWSFMLYAVLLVSSVYGLVLWRTRKLKRDKEYLEYQVRERTKQIESQKEEIESQRDEVIRQKDQLEKQRDLVVAQKNEITDSISYAQRIQTAVLPHQRYLCTVMPEHFILFKPRDIVSGDFYWIKEFHDSLIVVAADCTGHGVPGAFMSMLGITLLNELVGKSRFSDPGEILDKLRDEVKEILVQEGRIAEQKDGMDMAIVMIDKEGKELRYAGANNPVYLLRKRGNAHSARIEYDAALENGSHRLFELKGDRQPIGIYWTETGFTTRQVRLVGGDSIYLFSDGFADQKGGPDHKKFLSKNLKKLLLEIQDLSMEEQKEHLDRTIENWRNGTEQVDDILAIGIRPARISS